MKQKLDKNYQDIHKKRAYAIVKLIIFLIIFFICFGQVYNVTKRKYAYNKSEDFFKQDENFDILFFGSSHMLDGVHPMLLWKDYGIISYNMGNYSERIPTSYFNMLLALEHTNPKLIVVDAYHAFNNEKIRTERIEHLNNMLDFYPISYNKYMAVKELLDGENLIDKEIEELFNFSLYHSRWNEISKEDFVANINHEKGAESMISIAKPNMVTNFDDIVTYEGKETINMEYLRKMIEHCKENNIEVLITYLPYEASVKEVSASKYVQTICDEYDVNYINFLPKNMVNYNMDFYDKHHLNPSGARKITDYLGQYIMENYDIPDQRENDSYNFWYEDYDEYIDLKTENLEKNKKNLNNYLMLLYGEEDIKYEIKISSKKEINEGTTLYELLKNLDNNYQIDDTAFKENKNKTIKITTWDNRTGEKIDTVWF